MSILVYVTYMVIYCFGYGAKCMPTPLCVTDFLLYTVVSMCRCYLDVLYPTGFLSFMDLWNVGVANK